MTAEQMPDFVTSFNSGAFWGDENGLYVVGGQTNSAPYITPQRNWVPHNWTAFSAATVFKYEGKPQRHHSLPVALVGSTASDVGGFFFSGSSYAGTNQKDPNAPFLYTGTSNPVDNSNIMIFDTKAWRWSNKTTEQQSVEYGSFVLLPEIETVDSGLAIWLGGQETQPYNNMKSMKAVLVYDSRTGSWYHQETTAEDNDFPAPRTRMCAITASASDNSNHSIYIYAGDTPDVMEGFSDMYVLSNASNRKYYGSR
ncbi:hypothetical protein BCR34DRAFT_611751, partial [Clohesyomyces aquaticus]